MLLHSISNHTKNHRESIVHEIQVQLQEDYSSIFDFTVPTTITSQNTNDENHRGITATNTNYQQLRRIPHRQEQEQEAQSPDGYFNGGPIYKQRKKLSEISSYSHCVGETYQPSTEAWKDKSCHFHFLCYNTSSYDYILFENPSARHLAQTYALRPFAHISDNLHRHNHSDTVSLGGINLKWGHTGIPRLRWFPKILPLPPHPHPHPS